MERMRKTWIEIPVLMTVMTAGGAALADDPEVSFDVIPVVACRDVTPEDFVYEYPGKKLVEATYRISVRVEQAKDEDITETLFEITSPARRLEAIEFTPDTQLESEVVGSIHVTRSHEKGTTHGLNLGGEVGLPIKPVQASAQAGAKTEKHRRTVVTEKFKRSPPQRIAVVSGTIDGGQGVFFKFKPSGQRSFEGSGKITIRYAVLEEWRGDWVLLSCRAKGERKQLWSSQTEVWGRAELSVGLFLAGDPEAQAAAASLAKLERAAREAALVEPSYKDQLMSSFEHLACRVRLSKCCGRTGPPDPTAQAAQARQRLSALCGLPTVDPSD